MTTVESEQVTGACPVCGERFAPGDRFCEYCGSALTAQATSEPLAAQCTSCGAGQLDADGFCSVCGMRVHVPDRSELDLGGIVAAVTDLGKRHEHNEDAMALRLVEGAVVLVVCDGVSSSEHADDAAQQAAVSAADRLAAELEAGTDPESATAAAVAVAATAVNALGDRSESSPACTYVSAVLTATGVTVGWVGDSRAYWLAIDPDATPSQCLTIDDSVAAGLIALGVTEEQAMSSPGAHTLTAWLGADADRVEPHVQTFAPAGPGAVLVCSDGLWNYFSAANALADLAFPAAATAPLAAAHNLADLALAAGGGDNITVAVAPFPATSLSTPRMS
ncbi:PP2C family serine/threonine-protein phosphatase [Nocardia sp. NPDC020380]|uniref:PP2C family serine/threonine-protein phosphatase n=1 Tax=Nocardia sp. NPDC020380 TaxID=3364309 RepID=UPI0037A42ED9